MRSGKQNAAVEMRWAELLDENMPQELHRHIEEQKTACSEIVASKVSSTPLFVHTRYFGAMRVSDPDEADEGAAKNFEDAYVYIYICPGTGVFAFERIK